MDILLELRRDLKKAKGRLPAVAARAGVSYSATVRIMRGDVPSPRIGTVQDLREALDKVNANG